MKRGREGAGLPVFISLWGEIRNACVLLAELSVAYSASWAYTLSVLQSLPSRLIALGKELQGWLSDLTFASRSLSSLEWMARHFQEGSALSRRQVLCCSDLFWWFQAVMPFTRCWALPAPSDGRVGWIEESMVELGCWVDIAIDVLQFLCEENSPDAPWGQLIGNSLYLNFSTTTLSRLTFEFLSVSSEGMIVLYRRDLVCVWFKLKEEETWTGCFLLNTLAVKFCCGFFIFPFWGMLLFIKKVFLFLSLSVFYVQWTGLVWRKDFL